MPYQRLSSFVVLVGVLVAGWSYLGEDNMSSGILRRFLNVNNILKWRNPSAGLYQSSVSSTAKTKTPSLIMSQPTSRPMAHLAVACTALNKVQEVRVPTIKPQRGQVLIRIDSAALVAFDTYIVDLGYPSPSYPTPLGFNLAGTVIETGGDSGVLKVGDRVTAFTIRYRHEKATQQFVTLEHWSCAKIPDFISFEQAATIPDNFVTAFYTLFSRDNLHLPIPSSWPATTPPPNADSPILVYGGGATSGQYAIQLLRLAGYKRIFATASQRHHEYLRSLGATDTFDYTSPTWAEDLQAAVGGDGKIPIAVDAITAEGTLEAVSKVISPTGQVAILLPIKQGDKVRGPAGKEMWLEIPRGKSPFKPSTTVHGVGTVFYTRDDWFRNHLMPTLLPQLLESKVLQPNRIQLLDKGTFLERVQEGLELLRHNRVSGVKLVVKVPQE